MAPKAFRVDLPAPPPGAQFHFTREEVHDEDTADLPSLHLYQKRSHDKVSKHDLELQPTGFLSDVPFSPPDSAKTLDSMRKDRRYSATGARRPRFVVALTDADDYVNEHNLKRSLNARQAHFIALSATIGSGTSALRVLRSAQHPPRSLPGQQLGTFFGWPVGRLACLSAPPTRRNRKAHPCADGILATVAYAVNNSLIELTTFAPVPGGCMLMFMCPN